MRSLLLAFFVGLAVASNVVHDSAYRARKEYRYKYETQILTGLTQNSQQRVGYKMYCTARVQFNSVSSVAVQFENVVLYTIDQPIVQMEPDANILPNENIKEFTAEEVSRILRILQQPFGFKYTKGHVAAVSLDTEPDWSSNVKKGFVALFEVNLEKRLSLDDDTDIPDETPIAADMYTVFERSPTGDCATMYTTQPVKTGMDAESSHVYVRKVRDYSKCLEEAITMTSPFTGFHVGDESKTNPLSRQASVEYMIKGQEDKFIILSAVGQERIVFIPHYDPSSSEEIRTSVNQTLTLVDSLQMSDATLIRRPRVPRSKMQHLKLSLPTTTNRLQGSSPPQQIGEIDPFYSYTDTKIAEHFKMIASNVELLTSKESLVHLRLATEMMRSSPHQLQNAWTLLQRNPRENRKASEIFWSALPHVGTDAAANLILDICNIDPKMAQNCTTALSVMTLTVTPTQTMIEQLISLATKVGAKTYVPRQTVYLTLGSFGYKLKEDKIRQVKQSETAKSILKSLARDNAKIFRKYVKKETQIVERRIKRVESDFEKLAQTIVEALEPLVNSEDTTEQILGLKALGNSGLYQALPVLQAVLSKPDTTSYVKANALQALRRLAEYSETDLQEVQSTVFKIFMNTSEPTTVRISAVNALFCLFPELPFLEELASRMNTERDIDVSNYVLSVLETIANTTFSPLAPYIRDFGIALKAAPAKRGNMKNSFFKFMGQYSEKNRMGVSADIMRVGNMDEFSSWAVKLNTVIFGLYSSVFEMGVSAEGMGKILSGLMGAINSETMRTSDSPQAMIQNIIKELNIKTPDESKPSGDLYLRVMGNEMKYFDFTQLARRMLSGDILSEGLSSGVFAAPISMRSAMFLMNVKLSLPTEAGFPVGLQAQLSTALRVDGNISIKLNPRQQFFPLSKLNISADMNSTMVLGMYASMGMDGFFLKPAAGFYGLLKYRPPFKTEFRLSASAGDLNVELEGSKLTSAVNKTLVESIVEPMTEYVTIPTSATTPVAKVCVRPIFASQGVRTVPINSSIPMTWLGWKLQITGQTPVRESYPLPSRPLEGRSLMNLWIQPISKASAPENITITLDYTSLLSAPKATKYDKFGRQMPIRDQSHPCPVVERVIEIVSEHIPVWSRKTLILLVNGTSKSQKREFGGAITWNPESRRSNEMLKAVIFRSPIPDVSLKPWVLNATLLAHYPWKVYEPKDVYNLDWQRELIMQLEQLNMASSGNDKKLLNMTLNGMLQQFNYPAMENVPIYRVLDGMIPQHLIKTSNIENRSILGRNWQQWWPKLMPLYEEILQEKRRLVDQQFLNRDDFIHDNLQFLHETQLNLTGELEDIINTGSMWHDELPIMTWVVMKQADIVNLFREVSVRYAANGQITRVAEIQERIHEDSYMSKKLFAQVIKIMEQVHLVEDSHQHKLYELKKLTPPMELLLSSLSQLYLRQAKEIENIQQAIIEKTAVNVNQVQELIKLTRDAITFLDSFLAAHPMHNCTVTEKLMTVAVQNELIVHLWEAYWSGKDVVENEDKIIMDEIKCDKHLKLISYDLSPRVSYLYKISEGVETFAGVNTKNETQFRIVGSITRKLIVDQRTFQMKLFSNMTALQDPLVTGLLVQDLLARVDIYSIQLTSLIKGLSVSPSTPLVYLTGSILKTTNLLKSFTEAARQAMIPLSYDLRLELISKLDRRITSIQSIIASMSAIFEKYETGPSPLIQVPNTLPVYQHLSEFKALLLQQDQVIKQFTRFVLVRSVKDEELQQVLINVLDKAEQMQQTLQHLQPQQQQQMSPITSHFARAIQQQRQIYNIIQSVFQIRANHLHSIPEMQQKVKTLQQQLSALVPQLPPAQSSRTDFPCAIFGGLNMAWGEDKTVEGKFDITFISQRTVEQSYYIFNQLSSMVRSQELVDTVNRQLSGKEWSSDSLLETLNSYNHVQMRAYYKPDQMPSWFNSSFTSIQESIKHNLWNFYIRGGKSPVIPILDYQFGVAFDVSQLNKKFEMEVLTNQETDQFVNVPLRPLFDVLKPTQNVRSIYSQAIEFLGMAPSVCVMNENKIRSFQGAELILPEPEDGCGQLLVANVPRKFFVIAKPTDSSGQVHNVDVYAYDAYISVIPGTVNIQVNVDYPSGPNPRCTDSEPCFEIMKNGSRAEIRMLKAPHAGAVIVVEGSLIKVQLPQVHQNITSGLCLKPITSRLLGPDGKIVPNDKAFAYSYRVPNSNCDASKRIYPDSFQPSSQSLSVSSQTVPESESDSYSGWLW